MKRPRLVLDLTPTLERELFDDSALARLGAETELCRPGAQRPVERERLGADILVAGWGSKPLPSTRETADRLKLVAHTAGTVRWLVPKTLVSDGVRVTQAAAGMAMSVAEEALYFTQSLLRHLYAVDRAMVRGDWRGHSNSAWGRRSPGRASA